MNRISFDLDGTLLQYPGTLVPLAIEMQRSGSQVGILSAEPEKHIHKVVIPALKNLGFTPDFVVGSNKSRSPYGGVIWKPLVMAKDKIDVHFDNEGDRMKPTYGKIITV